MDSMIRGVVVYAFLLVIFRVSGKQTLSRMTSFDLILLLIISETTQQAMVANDNSITNAFLLIISLVGLTVILSALKQFFRPLAHLLEGQPVIVLERGKLLHEVMDRVRVDEEDILAFARKTQGLERLDQIKYAILERDGNISIIPAERPGQHG